MPGHAVITGAHVTQVGELPGCTTLGLHMQAACGAAADAGLTLDQLDGVLCAYSLAEPQPMLASAFCEYANLRPAFSAVVQAGGASAAIMVVQAAALALAAMPHATRTPTSASPSPSPT